MTQVKENVKNSDAIPRNAWSEAQINLLVRLWGTVPVADIAERLGRNPNSVAIKASRLGLPPLAQRKALKTLRGANPKARVRPCLSCQTPFFSEGPHNRICEKCKDAEIWRTGGGASNWSGR